MAATTRCDARCGSSCSHTRTTFQPARRSLRLVSMSPPPVISILARHHPPFHFGHGACWGQPCQKQPSTNTTTLARTKVRSALRRASGNLRSTRKRRPSRWSTERSASSHCVSRLGVACIRRRTDNEEASGRLAVWGWDLVKRDIVCPFEVLVVPAVVRLLDLAQESREGE